MIGIFGGTFDPVHYGHLKTVQHVQQQAGLEQVRLVPLGQAVHREQPVASARQRLEMLSTAIDEYPQLQVDDREINRPGGSYTVDTLKSLKQEFPGKSFCLIVGSDAFSGFLNWHLPETILSLANIIVMQRPQAALNYTPLMTELLNLRQVTDQQLLKQQPAGKILFLQVPQLDISSTQIRQRLRSQQSVDHLLPAPVLQLIRQWGLYIDSNQPQA